MPEPVPLDGPPTSAAGSSDRALAEAVDRIGARLRRGERVDPERELAENPACADGLRLLWPTLQALVAVRPGGKIAHPTSLGDFELIRELGRGGMGIVYEAWQVSLRRRVAVKVLPAASLLDERQLQRFQNEARAAAQLNHPHIVDVICVGCDAGVHYFAMRLVEGPTLAEVIALASGTRESAGSTAAHQGSGIRHLRAEESDAESPTTTLTAALSPRERGPVSVSPSPPRPLSPSQSAEWIAQAAEALEHAHASGVVHRDVKPSNLLVDGAGKLWVTDFGVARFGDDAGLTFTGDLLGTLRYMSPEQALGRLASIGPRSDVYSLGATLYELLASRPVFDGEDRGDLLRQVAFERPLALRTLDPRLPRDLETIAHKALEKSPDDRYTSAGEMACDLRRFLRGEPIRAKPPTAAERVFKWSLRHRRLVAALAAALVLAVVGLSVGMLLISRSRSEAVVARKLFEDRDRENRRMLSAIETRLALQASQRGELERASELLERQVPGSRIRENSTSLGPVSDRAPPADDFRDFTWHWLRGAIGERCPEVQSFDGHPGEVFDIDYSRDGTLLAAACQGKIVVRDVSSGKIRHLIDAHTSDVNSAKFSPDGALLASVGDDHRVRLWDSASGELAADLGTHDCEAVSVAFSPDGRLLASGDHHGLVIVWDVAGRREDKRLTEGQGRIDSAAFVDRHTLVAVSDDDLIAWDVGAGRVRWKVAARHTPLVSVAVSPDGATLAAGDHVGRVGLWNASDGRALATLGARGALIEAVAFSPDGKLLAAGGQDGITQLWDIESQSYCGQTAPHRDRVWSVAFSPDSRTLATAGRDRSVKLWDVTTRRQPRRFTAERTRMLFAYSPSGDLAFFGDDQFWLCKAGIAAPVVCGSLGPNAGPALSWLDGRLISTRPDGDLVLIDVDGGAASFWAGRQRPCDSELRVSPDASWLSLIGGGFGELWHIKTRKLLDRCEGLLAVFSSDGKYAILSKNKRLLRLRLTDLGAAEEVIADDDQSQALALSPDDRLLALANFDSTIEIRDMATGERRLLAGHERAVGTVAFSPDGRTLASGGLDGTLRLWRVDVGEQLGILERRWQGDIQQVAFSPDGTRLAAAGRDGAGGAISVWEIDPK